MPRKAPFLICAALAALLAPQAAEAQFGLFGPNKIQYRRFDWRILRGERVDLHFYPEETELARVALAYAEETYRDLEIRLRHVVADRIPLIVYASHTDFEQTNLLPFVPPEGLLGFTEFARSRVALPFRGNYHEFRHTIRHELVHVFQLSMLRSMAALYPRVRRVNFPLWWTEGTAEYWSEGEDSQDDMILRDLTHSGRLPTVAQLTWASGGLVYPVGGSLVRYLAARYGEWRFVRAYEDAWRYDSFEQLVEVIFGRTLEQITAEWHHALRTRYYPLVAGQRPLALDARRLARAAIKPAVWMPPGDTVPEVLYLSPRTGYTDVYAVPLSGGRARTVVKGERSAELESFRPFDSRIDVTSDGVLAFGGRFQDRDALFLWDLRSGEMVGRYRFPDLVSVVSPAWAPDGRSLVFSGLSLSGYSDLYRLHLPEGRLQRLTSDRYQDADPSFSPDGTRVVFSSDRTAYGEQGATNLFVLDLATGAVRPLTNGNWRDRTPRWPESDLITFTSDRFGTQDIFVVDTSGSGRRVSGLTGGAYDPVWLPQQRRWVLGGFEDLQFSLYVLPQPPDTGELRAVLALGDTARTAAAEHVIALEDTAAAGRWRWRELEDDRYSRLEPARYERRFHLDFAAADAILIPGRASAQGATFVMSDMLADHVLYFNVVAVQSNSFTGLLGGLNGTAIYINQTGRINWGVGAFRYRGRFYDGDFNRQYDEAAGGAFLMVRYPLSRFSRLESQLRSEYSDRTELTPEGGGFTFPRRAGFLTSNYLSYVRDNALWLPTGPIDGGRLNLTAGLVNDLTHGRFDSWLVSADMRRYYRTSLYTAFALRLAGHWSGGEVPQRIAIGGSHALRGYPRYSYVSGTRSWLINAEWRFPVTDYLSIGFPFGEWRFPGVQGALFWDLGRAWTPRTAYRRTLGSYGLGFRMNIGFPIVLRLDLGWRYGAYRGSDYSLPLDFRSRRFADLWFGFNY